MFSIVIDTRKLPTDRGERFHLLARMVDFARATVAAHLPVSTIAHPSTGENIGWVRLHSDETDGGSDNPDDAEALRAGVAALVDRGLTIHAERLREILDWVESKHAKRKG